MSFTTIIHTMGARIVRNAPTILSVAASAGVVATGYLAYKAGSELYSVKTKYENAMKEYPDTSTEAASKLRKQFLWDTVKILAPTVISGAATVGCIVWSNRLATKQIMAITGAYKSLETAFKTYREKMVDAVGEEKVNEIMARPIELSLDSPDCKKINELESVYGMIEDVFKASPYARLIDDTSTAWDPNEDYLFMNISAIQNWANRRLRTKGHLFLNEVYDQLGVSRTPEGSVCGWIANSEDGDGYVDFGNPESCAWRYYDGVRKHNVTECVLDFNIDGVIWDRI